MRGPLRRFFGLLVCVALAAGADDAAAQCAIVGVKSSSKQKINLTRAYAPCAMPDVVSTGGLPACSAAVPNPSDWAADSAKSRASLKLVSEKDGDLTFLLKLKGLLAADLVNFASGTGDLVLTIVATFDDPVEGLITTAPFPVSGPVVVDKGATKATLSLAQMMDTAGLGSIGSCWSLELTGLSLEDPSGNPILTGVTPSFSERGSGCCSGRG